MGHVHMPTMHLVPAGHVLLQEPQLFGSVLTSMQVPLQTRLGAVQGAPPVPLLELVVEVDVVVVEVDVDIDDEDEVMVVDVDPMVAAPAMPPVAVPVFAGTPPPPKKPSPDGPGQPTTTAARNAAAAAPDA
jgi:hypothetical protein